MSGIFISYRREDSSGWVGGLSRALRESFGTDQIFRDIDTLGPGVDYTKVIEDRITSCEVVLVVIGPRWLTISDKKSQRRLDNPADLVRIEVAAALRRGIQVVPVLVGGASMPTPEELPNDLQELVRRNAYELSDRRWDYDQEQLIKFLEGSDYLNRQATNKSKTSALSLWFSPRMHSKVFWLIAVLIASAVLLSAGYGWHIYETRLSINSEVSSINEDVGKFAASAENVIQAIRKQAPVQQTNEIINEYNKVQADWFGARSTDHRSKTLSYFGSNVAEQFDVILEATKDVDRGINVYFDNRNNPSYEAAWGAAEEVRRQLRKFNEMVH